MAKGEMGDSKSTLGFLVLLLIVLFSGTSSGEFQMNLRGNARRLDGF